MVEIRTREFRYHDFKNDENMPRAKRLYARKNITRGATVLGILFFSLVVINHLRIVLLRDEYEEWKRNYDSDYLVRSMGFDQSLDRFPIWLKSRQFVKSHKSESYTVELNRFAHLTDMEYNVFANDFRSLKLDWPHFGCQLFNHNSQFIATAKNFDWRSLEKVTPVRNQANCGSCWAFAATAALESARAIKENVLEFLSPQQMVDCAVGEYGYSEYPNHGCNGGLPESAFTYSHKVGYLPESYYPYQAKDQNCSLLNEDNHFLNSHLKKTSGCGYIESENEKAALEALVEVGPLAVALDAGQLSFRFYKEGIYYEPECSSARLSHAVTLVGYGLNETNIVNMNGTDTDLTGFWSIKNSWGTKWGENGYFRIAKHENNCGITTVPSFPIL